MYSRNQLSFIIGTDKKITINPSPFICPIYLHPVYRFAIINRKLSLTVFASCNFFLTCYSLALLDCCQILETGNYFCGKLSPLLYDPLRIPWSWSVHPPWPKRPLRFCLLLRSSRLLLSAALRALNSFCIFISWCLGSIKMCNINDDSTSWKNYVSHNDILCPKKGMI